MALGTAGLSAADSGDETLGRLGADPVLKQFLEAVPAGSPYVVYAALVAPDGSTVVSSADGFVAGLETQDIEQLTGRNAVGRVFSLLEKGQMFAVTTPVARGNQHIGSFVLLIDTSLIRDHLRGVLRESAWIIVLALLVAWLAALATAMLTRRLVRRIQLQVDRLRAGDFDFEPAPLSDPGFERLANQLRTLGQDFKSERLELLAEKKSLEEILQHIQLGVMVIDEDERILFFNRPLEAMVGATLEEVVGRPIEKQLDANNPLRRILRKSERHGENLDALLVSLPTTGRFRESMISVFSLALDGSPRGSVLLLEDLTGYKALMALADYGAFAGDFSRHAASIVHNIRTPLGTLLSHVEVLRHRVTSGQDVGRSLDIMQRTIEEFGALLEELLDFLRRKPLETAPLDLCKLIRQVAEFYSPDLQKRGIDVALDLERAPCLVDGDENSLRQVLINLISNAVDAMPDGGRLELRTAAEDEGTLGFEVTDTGNGIRHEETSKIFKLYYTSKPAGRGIGLAMVHRIVTEHGGVISVDSTPGEGTTFSVRLPACEHNRRSGGADVEEAT
jgi:two-component system sensor histidine kinase AtoS